MCHMCMRAHTHAHTRLFLHVSVLVPMSSYGYFPSFQWNRVYFSSSLPWASVIHNIFSCSALECIYSKFRPVNCEQIKLLTRVHIFLVLFVLSLRAYLTFCVQTVIGSLLPLPPAQRLRYSFSGTGSLSSVLCNLRFIFPHPCNLKIF